jgi:Ca2+-binding RTX toxin-like protein
VGADQFVFTSVEESAPAAADQILDFSKAQGDRIVLSLIDADHAIPDDQAFIFVTDPAFTGAGQVRAFQSGSETLILLNTDVDADAEMMIRVTGVHAVDASCFVL